MTSLLFGASSGREPLPGIRHATVRSEALGHRADLSTLVVPGTAPEAIVILLHGVYGSHWSWVHQGVLTSCCPNSRPIVSSHRCSL